jgi:hypothetical protein
MATDTRPGFRLPWGGGNEPGNETTDDRSTDGDAAVAQDGQEAQEPEMIEHADPAEATAPPEDHAANTPEPVPARKATKFMAELSRAMQVAAETARAELMSRFEAEAKGVVEQVQAGATDEAAALRRKADDDVAAIREWSKAEVARLREETEGRIATRKTGLEGEMEQHAATVEARVERVTAVVAAFETQMAAFFERLNAEEDPTRIATMAETMPEPPSLADVAASIANAPASHLAPPTATTEPMDTVTGAAPVAEFDFAAAEAEAASFSGDLDADEVLAAAGAEGTEGENVVDEAVPFENVPSADLASTRIVVSGLVSVANIANFKRSLSRTAGVSTIGVASGPDGDFVFTVGHTLGSALTASIVGLSGFDIQLTGESDEAITVVAQDRDATD